MKSAALPEKLRIVSLAPSITSILIKLGARRQLVAGSRWCKEVADVRGLPELGDCWSIDTAPIENLRPSLIAGSVPFRTEAVQKILALPVPFLALNPRSLADVYADIRILGRLTNRAASAKALICEMQRKFEAVRRAAARSKSRPRVYAEAWPNPRISSPPWVAEMIEIAGGTMVLPSGERVSDEAVAEARPDVIVLAWTATGGRSKASEALENPKWKDVPAVKNERVAVVRDELLNTPGPPLVCGAQELLRVLHPEVSARGKARSAK